MRKGAGGEPSLRAAKHGAKSDVDRECLEANLRVGPAETQTRGNKFRADRSSIGHVRRGIIPAVDFIVTRQNETIGYRTMMEIGLQDMRFEAVVLRYSDKFASDAGEASRRRWKEWGFLP